jgi:hypothetical protein
MYPREDYNIDAAMQVPENAGGSVALLGDLSKAKTIRVIAVETAITDDATIDVFFDTGNTVSVQFDVLTAGNPLGGVAIAHVRGALLDGKTQDVAYQLVQNSGSASIGPNGGIFLELVDTVRR